LKQNLYEWKKKPQERIKKGRRKRKLYENFISEVFCAENTTFKQELLLINYATLPCFRKYRGIQFI
jgi:hypothetical protein